MKTGVLEIILGFTIVANVQPLPYIQAADIQAKNVGSLYPYYEWSQLHFNFPDPELEAKLIKNNLINQKNLNINGVKICGSKMILSLPRYLSGGSVPVTLAIVDYKVNPSISGVPSSLHFPKDKSPKLTPYPSYEMQEPGNCKAFQNVQSMDIDQFGRLWVPDTGRVDLLTPNPINNCPAKLVVIDLKTDQVEFTYTFPEDVVSPTTHILKDLSVACTTRDDCWVYISNLADFKIVVFDVKNNQSWSAAHPTMQVDPETVNFKINGVKASPAFGVTGQFLSPKSDNFSTLYYSSLSRKNLYMIKTDTLKNPALKKNNNLKADDVKDLGPKKGGNSDGLAMNNKGDIFYGALPESAIYKTRMNAMGTQLDSSATTQLAQDDEILCWPDTIGFDGHGNVALTATHFHLFESGAISDNVTRFRVEILYGQGYASNSG